MEFFNEIDGSSYFKNKFDQLFKEIENICNNEIITCDFNEWIDYLFSKYFILPIQIFEENILSNLSEVKVKRYNYYHREIYEPEYFMVDGYKISYTIYFDGEYTLFKVQPSTRILSRFSYNSFEKPNENNCGKFTLEFEYGKQELDKIENVEEVISNNFSNKFGSYLKMIKYVNLDVDKYNNSLKSYIESELQNRKNKANSFQSLSEKLKIPMKLNSFAPNTVPIPLKRINRVVPTKPQLNLSIKEYGISTEDYININNIILMCGTTMENTAQTYRKHNEEELRDHIISTLSTHYDNTSGETFRKKGKTDILIDFDNKSAFIGECKIWHGSKVFMDAISQLLGYTTWKDGKISIIIFNKNNKSFREVINKINEWVKHNTNSYLNKKPNFWECKYFRFDTKEEIDLSIIAFDLYSYENLLNQ